MKTKLIALLAITFLIITSCEKAEDPELSETEVNGLVVEIKGLKNSDGVIQLELNDENENYLDGFTAEIVDNVSTITITGLSSGKYAFKYFHDKNSNEELDMKLGLPQEGYGFSNNAKGTFGPPKFKDMVFEYSEPVKMTCTITYIF